MTPLIVHGFQRSTFVNMVRYYYYWIVCHLGHERNVFPELGIAPDEKVVAAALPKIENALDALERELGHDRDFLITDEPTLADFVMLPMVISLNIHKDGQGMLATKPSILRWREKMEALPSVGRFRVSPPPRTPIWHAREWAVSHRPKY